MNIENLLQISEDLRTALERMGVTTQGLLIAFAIAILFFIFSLREVISWFMKIPQLRGEIRSQRKQIGEMQKSLEHLRDMLLAQTAAGNTEEFDKDEDRLKKKEALTTADGGKRFNFDH
jgi:hypothetical protein